LQDVSADVSKGGKVKAGDIVFIKGHVMVAIEDSDEAGNFAVIDQGELRGSPAIRRDNMTNTSRVIGCFRPIL
jgi:hypothetical protein